MRFTRDRKEFRQWVSKIKIKLEINCHAIRGQAARFDYINLYLNKGLQAVVLSFIKNRGTNGQKDLEEFFTLLKRR